MQSLQAGRGNRVVVGGCTPIQYIFYSKGDREADWLRRPLIVLSRKQLTGSYTSLDGTHVTSSVTLSCIPSHGIVVAIAL